MTIPGVQNSLWAEVARRAVAATQRGVTPVAVFDLDGCLYDVGHRHWHILKEFAETTDRTELSNELRKLSPNDLPYLLRDTLAMAGFDDSELVREAAAFWLPRFFDEEHQLHDCPTPGAVKFVRELHRLGATVVYLTGRNVPGMLTGCTTALRRDGFPVGCAGSTLVLKPDFDDDDTEFKREAVRFISTLGEIVAGFENEPAASNLFAQSWPGALVGWIDTNHSPDPPPLRDDVVSFKSFADGQFAVGPSGTRPAGATIRDADLASNPYRHIAPEQAD